MRVCPVSDPTIRSRRSCGPRATANGGPRWRTPAAAPPQYISAAPPPSLTGTARPHRTRRRRHRPLRQPACRRLPACSDRYAADAFHLLRAGLAGDEGKDVPASITERPRAFLTLTAPSFGPVHTRKISPRGFVVPYGCGELHHGDDPRVGTAAMRARTTTSGPCCGRPMPVCCGDGSPPRCAAPSQERSVPHVQVPGSRPTVVREGRRVPAARARAVSTTVVRRSPRPACARSQCRS